MNIKKVDDKPMVIHTKEKTKIHVKAEPEAKIKGRNILVVEKSPKAAGSDKAENLKQTAKENVRKTVQKENRVYAQYQRSKQDKEKAIGKTNSTVSSVASVGTMAVLDQMDGGNEVYESYQVARTLTAPAESAANAGKRLYRSQVAKARAEKIKKCSPVRKSEKRL